MQKTGIRNLRVSTSAFCLLLSAFVQAAPSKKDATAELLAATADGKGDRIIAALAAGADPNARNEQKTPALLTITSNTVWGDEKAVIAAFVKAKANLNITNSDGTTPLMAAAAKDRPNMIEPLIAGGAKVEATDTDGWTAIHYAANNGNWRSIEKLIAAKANLNAAAKDGWTAMMMALDGGKGGIAEKLVKAEAKMPTAWPDGASSLIHAVSGRDLGAVRIVLASNPKIDEAAEDGFTPLSIAAYDGDAQIVMELLRAGANPSIKDKKGKTALDLATEREYFEVAALLGGPWKKPKPKGGKTISVPCPALGGAVETNFGIDGKALVVTTTYPHPMSYYFGGGHMNRAETAKKFTYEGGFAPGYYLDTDSNPKTGRKTSFLEKDAGGSEYSIDYSEYGTSVTLNYLNSKGEERSKQVYGNVLDVSVKKGEEDVDFSSLGDEIPRAENDTGVLRSRIPLSLVGLKPGSAMRVTAKIGSCDAVTSAVSLK